MLIPIQAPRTDTKQPLGPGVVYTQRGREFGRLTQRQMPTIIRGSSR